MCDRKLCSERERARMSKQANLSTDLMVTFSLKRFWKTRVMPRKISGSSISCALRSRTEGGKEKQKNTKSGKTDGQDISSGPDRGLHSEQHASCIANGNRACVVCFRTLGHAVFVPRRGDLGSCSKGATANIQI
jgi:hypothetical protein